MAHTEVQMCQDMDDGYCQNAVSSGRGLGPQQILRLGEHAKYFWYLIVEQLTLNIYCINTENKDNRFFELFLFTSCEKLLPETNT